MKKLLVCSLVCVALAVVGCDGGGGGGGDEKDAGAGAVSNTGGSDSSGGSKDSASGTSSGASSGSVVLPGPIGIAITSVPLMGQSGKASGLVAGVNPSEYVVAMYICVSGAWWIKPYSGSTIKINGNGTWSASMTTGGSDVWATQVVAYLVPIGVAVPNLLGSSSLPSSLAGYVSSSLSR